MRAIKLCSSKILEFLLGCRLTQVVVYNGHKTVVVVVVAAAAAAAAALCCRQYRDGVGNAIEENSSIFCLILMH